MTPARYNWSKDRGAYLDSDGAWVTIMDYEKLKAENEVLREVYHYAKDVISSDGFQHPNLVYPHFKNAMNGAYQFYALNASHEKREQQG